jgi:HTH-type transcriptional regulator/antitoxin HigA
MAWTARAMELARSITPRGRYEQGCLTEEVLRGLVHLSALDDGPRKAQEYLSKYGVTLIVVKHLPETRLDGAVFFLAPDRPVVCLTLRYDRVDNFWFTLLHEIGHLVRDFGDEVEGFFDDLESSGEGDPREVAADNFAQDSLIPTAEWEGSPVRSSPNPAYVRHLAARLGIHPAIVAGRVQHERNAFRILNNLVGHGSVRPLFSKELGRAIA